MNKAILNIILLSFFTAGFCGTTMAQDIKGFKIFVSRKADSYFIFNGTVTNWDFVEKDGYTFYSIQNQGATTVTVNAKKEAKDNYTLLIQEGPRRHKFYIIYKEDISEAETEHDYSDLKVLKKLIKDEESKPKEEIATAADKPKEIPVTTTQNAAAVSPPATTTVKEDNNTKFVTLVTESNNAYTNGNYDEAETKIKQALAINPADEYAKTKLEQITARKSEKEAAGKKENYNDVITGANKAFKANNYEEAKTLYNQALAIKPGDTWAKGQLNKIEGSADAAKKQQEDKKMNDLFQSYMDAGDKYFTEKAFDDAAAAYNQALGVKANDPIALSKLKEVDRKSKETASLLENQKKLEEVKKTNDQFQNYMDAGNKYFTEKAYDDAAAAYNQALSVKANDPTALAKLKEIDRKSKETAALQENQKKLEEIKKKDDEYKGHISTGDKAFSEKSYEAAANAYKLALTIKPTDTYAGSKLKEIDNRIKDDKQKEESQKIDASYKSFMDIGDDALQNKSFEDARNAYKEALKLKPNDATATKQVNKIDGAIAAYNAEQDKLKKNKELQDKYNEAISLAGNAYDAGVYDVAKEEYKKALLLKPNEPVATKKIEEINGILSKLVTENNKRIKDSVTTAKYNAAITKGDNSLAAKDYKNAIASYQLAASLKPAEQYPTQKIATIEAERKAEADRLALERKIENQYNAALQNGNAALKYNQLESAQKAYAEAVRLKPGTEPAQTKLKDVTDKIAAIAKEKEITEKYETAIHNGDSLASTANGLQDALKWYKEAQQLRPEKDLAKKQISYVERRLGVDSASVADKKRQAAYDVENDKLKIGLAAFDKGNSLIKEKNYEGALTSFNEFLNISLDTNILNPYKTQRVKFQFARDKAKDLKDYLDRTRKPEPPPVVKVEETGKKKKRKSKPVETPAAAAETDKGTTVIYFPNQKDVDMKDLKSKYPNIDFNAAPPDQKFNELSYSKQNNKDIQTITEETPRLSLTGTENNIKLTCTGISFKNANAYFKFTVQNNYTGDFLTGPMILTRNGANGKTINLYPAYISEFPVVSPGKEKIIIYVINALDLPADENLVLELNDRLKTLKTTVNIPGDVYNKEKQR